LCGKFRAQKYYIQINPPPTLLKQHGISKEIGMEGEAAPTYVGFVSVVHYVVRRPNLLSVLSNDPPRHFDSGVIICVELNLMTAINETPQAH
jgi:hypothetical protein